MKPFFSIIIPIRKLDNYLLECLEWCINQEYKKFEVILLPDYKISNYTWKEIPKKVKIIPTGRIYPSGKRNIGIKNSKGAICAFIDSDAYPKQDWLKNSIKYFKNRDIAAVGGPNIPPKNDSFLNQITGDIVSNIFAMGATSKRFKRFKKNFLTHELSCSNLLVKKSILGSIGGFDEKYLTGEDSKLCFHIKKRSKKILYAKDVQVYHHQRPWLSKYLKQIWTWGLNKGNLISKKDSIPKIEYFIPSFFVIFLIVGFVLSFYIKKLFLFYISIISLYLITSLIFSFKSKIIRVPFVFIGIVATHITYGISFLIGMTGLKHKFK